MNADSRHPTPSNQSIYSAALKLPNDSERQRFLDQACGGDVARRRKIERLLAVGEPALDSPLDRIVDQLGPANTWADALVGDRSVDNGQQDPLERIHQTAAEHPTIDSYKLLEQIGEGGMGAVFMAQQTEPIKRMVALKLIKPGMDSRHVIARFEAERQTLALMDHPGIARVLDAGTTPQGRPYFVMELVRGVPITKYCDEQRLSIENRLRLFIDVCRAVQHAHQKGIIHRDLKPSNVMITLHDGMPVVKVIDFGVAKALNQELTEQTLFTQFAQMIGTPLYMSPEQAEMSGLDIDTRSDVYSLGVLLYELLTGTTPFDRDALAQAGFDGMRRIIREQEPSRPSHQIGTLKADTLTTIASRRLADPRQLSLAMKRELDWIVMKALEKDRNRRYESASALAADVNRYLSDQPVEACPPSALYGLRKLTKRHRGFLTAAAVTAVLMLVGLIVSSRLAYRASTAEQIARAARDKAEQTNEEMRGLLYASDVMLASRDWRQNDVQKVRERLARHIPHPSQRDLRGFEWHFLWNQQVVEGSKIADLGSAVYDIALSPDGTMFAATGEAAVIHIFDMNSGALKAKIATQQRETNGIDFSPNSTHIAATGDDGTLRVWELDSGQLLWKTQAHDGIAYQVRYAPDGKTLTSCGEDDRVRLWEAASGSSLGTLNEHEVDIETIDMSTSGIVAAGDRASKLSLWDATERTAVWTTGEGEFDPISSVVFSNHGYLAQASLGGQLVVMDIQNRGVVSQRRLDTGIQSLAFASQGTWLAVGDRAGHLRVVHFENGLWDLRPTREWLAHEGRVYAVEVTPDGRQVLSGGTDGRVMAWHPNTGQSEHIASYPRSYWNIEPIEQGGFVLAGFKRTIVCDRFGEVVRDLGPIGFQEIDVAAGGALLFAMNAAELTAWNVDSGAQFFHWQQEEQVENTGLVASSNGKTVCLTSKRADSSRQIQIIDVDTKRIKAQFPVQNGNSLAISPDGHWLVFDTKNEILLYDLEKLTVVDTWRGHQGSIRSLAFSHDGQRLGSVSEDRTLKLWSVPDGKVNFSVIAHRTQALDLAFTPDGRRIATAGEDRTLRIWDGQNAEPLWEYAVAQGRTRRLSFSLDGQTLVALCDRHHVLILDGSPLR